MKWETSIAGLTTQPLTATRPAAHRRARAIARQTGLEVTLYACDKRGARLQREAVYDPSLREDADNLHLTPWPVRKPYRRYHRGGGR